MKKNNKLNPKDPKMGLVDVEKLKEFGITKDLAGDSIEEVDGENIIGGKNTETDPTVATHWPTGK